MSAAHISLLTYVWHYVVARLLYDDLVRPLTRGAAIEVALAVLACVGVLVWLYLKRVRRLRRGGR